MTDWIDASAELPPNGVPVVAVVLDRDGKRTWLRAAYYAEKTLTANYDWGSEDAEYDEDADEYYAPAGWYEVMDNGPEDCCCWRIPDVVIQWQRVSHG